MNLRLYYKSDFCIQYCLVLIGSLLTLRLDGVLPADLSPLSASAILYECQSDQRQSSEGAGSTDSSTIKILFGKNDPGAAPNVFRLSKNSQPLGCSKETKLLKITMPLTFKAETEAVENAYVLSANVRIKKVSILRSTGQLRLGNGRGVSVFYEPTEYCIQKLNTTHTEFQVCQSHCTMNSNQNPNTNNKGIEQEICIEKCCPPGSTLSFHKSKNPLDQPLRSCQPSGEKFWKPTFWNSREFQDGIAIARVDETKEPRFRIMTVNQNRTCENPLLQPRISFQHDGVDLIAIGWRLLDNGSLIIRNASILEDEDGQATDSTEILDIKRQWRVLDKSHFFCIDGMQDFGDPTFGAEYAGYQKRSHQLVHVCYDSTFNGGSENILKNEVSNKKFAPRPIESTTNQSFADKMCCNWNVLLLLFTISYFHNSILHV